MRPLPIAHPNEPAPQTPTDPVERGPTRPHEHEHDRAPARSRARAREEPGSRPSGEVVTFPGASLPVTRGDHAGMRELVTVWTGEAAQTAHAAIDGSVWRARPPSLRDMTARTTRAEWAGGWPALRVAGQVYGHVATVAVAGLYAVAWVIRRPLRLAGAAALGALAWGLLTHLL